MAGLYRIADKAGMYKAVRSTALPIFEIRAGRLIEVPDWCCCGFRPA
jgi:hypothetical protein